MILLITQYLLAGTVLGFLIESVVRNTGHDVDRQERRRLTLTHTCVITNDITDNIMYFSVISCWVLYTFF